MASHEKATSKATKYAKDDVCDEFLGVHPHTIGVESCNAPVDLNIRRNEHIWQKRQINM